MEFYYANGPSWEKKLLWKKLFFYSKLKVLLLCLKHNCTFLENEPTEYFRFGVSELPMGRAFKILHVSSGSFFSGQTPFQTSCACLLPHPVWLRKKNVQTDLVQLTPLPMLKSVSGNIIFGANYCLKVWIFGAKIKKKNWSYFDKVSSMM